ncbi:MAG: O-antigen ligase family protein [Lachnospiraceae bacterium]|nr:O-antigen ligase family protein [Lachnospiraceae bacterium]
MKEINRKKENAGKTKMEWNWKLLPLQFVLALLPMIVYLYRGNSGYMVYPWHSSNDSYLDVFLHGKMVAFMVVAVVTLVLAVYKMVRMKAEERKRSICSFLPLFIYLGFVVLSTICSENSAYSVSGSMDAKEPVGVLAGYVVVALYAYIILDDLKDIVQLTASAVAGSVLMASLGILQAVGRDPLATEGVQLLFAGREFLDTFGLLQLTFPVGQAYGTLFNPNYVGTYVAMYVPLLLVGLVMYKQWWKKIVTGLALCGLMITLFASQSRTGLIAIAAVIVMLVIFLGRELLKRWYVVIPGLTLLVMSFFLVDHYRDNILTNRLKEMFLVQNKDMPVSGVDTTGKGVRVLYKDTEFTVQMLVLQDSFGYVVTENGTELPVTYNETGTYGYVTLENGDQIAIQTAAFENNYAFGLVINGRNFYFTNQFVAGNYQYINELGRLDECTIPENVFPGYEAAASGRGYVWGRTIPLLWKNFVVGSGPDTFTIEFPQNDYVARYKSGFDNVIFTRPHNFYLQMGVQTGVLSLIAFLVFYGMYFVGCCRRYFVKKFTGMEQWIGLAVFLCTVGFMVSGLANDSLIVVTPVFYVLLGMGMMINQKLCPLVPKESRKKGGQKAVEEEEAEHTQAVDMAEVK